MLEARDILRVFCSSRSSPGNVAWNAAGIRREATETVIIEADVWATRLLYSCSGRRRPPTKKHIPRIYVNKANTGCFVQGGYSRGCCRVSRPGRWLFFPAPTLLWRRLIPEFSVRFHKLIPPHYQNSRSWAHRAFALFEGIFPQLQNWATIFEKLSTETVPLQEEWQQYNSYWIRSSHSHLRLEHRSPDRQKIRGRQGPLVRTQVTD